MDALKNGLLLKIQEHAAIALHEVSLMPSAVANPQLLVMTDLDKATAQIAALLHDRMTENLLADRQQAEGLFATLQAAPMARVDVLGGGRTALETANREFGLALVEAVAHVNHLRRQGIVSQMGERDGALLWGA